MTALGWLRKSPRFPPSLRTSDRRHLMRPEEVPLGYGNPFSYTLCKLRSLVLAVVRSSFGAPKNLPRGEGADGVGGRGNAEEIGDRGTNGDGGKSCVLCLFRQHKCCHLPQGGRSCQADLKWFDDCGCGRGRGLPRQCAHWFAMTRLVA